MKEINKKSLLTYSHISEILSARKANGLCNIYELCNTIQSEFGNHTEF